MKAEKFKNLLEFWGGGENSFRSQFFHNIHAHHLTDPANIEGNNPEFFY